MRYKVEQGRYLCLSKPDAETGLRVFQQSLNHTTDNVFFGNHMTKFGDKALICVDD